ncbi:MAG: hypothetical protein ABIP03_04030, partial [Aquihabitans sp.]
PVGVSLQGTSADLIAGKPVTLAGCDGHSLDLPAGSTTVRTAPGALTGFDLDRVVLRSAAGGEPGPASGTLVPRRPSGRAPELTVTTESVTSTNLTVTGASDRFWLILGQSHNAGWRATANGRDLGPPTLVNGYANGWEVPAGQRISIQLEWVPQRVVRAALGASVASLLVCLALALGWPRCRRCRLADLPGDSDDAGADWLPLDARPSMPRSFSLDRVMHFSGPTPSRFALIGTVISASVFGWAFIGPISGAVLGLAAAVCLRWARARPLLTVAGPLVFAGCVGWLGANQLFRELPSGFDWPTYFEAVQQPTLVALGLLVLDPVIDRCWLRRWWLTDDSPT